MNLRLKLLLPLLSVFLVCFSIFIQLTVMGQEAELSQSLEAKSVILSELFATTNVLNLWNLDKEGLQSNLDTMLKDQEVSALEIKDAKGITVAKKVDADQYPEAKSFTKEQKIIHEGEAIGTAISTFTTHFSEVLVAKTRWQLILTGGLIFLLMGAMIVFLANLITKPISRLVEVVRGMATGDGNLAVEIAVTSRDEVGKLSGHFNSFLGKLRTIVVNLKSVGGKSGGLSAKLAENTRQVSVAVEEISANMRSMTTRTEAMNGEVQNSVGSVQAVNGHIDRVNAMIED